MRLAAHRTVIEAAVKNATIAHLTINAALDRIPAKERRLPREAAYVEVAPDEFVRVKQPTAEELEANRRPNTNVILSGKCHVGP